MCLILGSFVHDRILRSLVGRRSTLRTTTNSWASPMSFGVVHSTGGTVMLASIRKALQPTHACSADVGTSRAPALRGTLPAQITFLCQYPAPSAAVCRTFLSTIHFCFRSKTQE